jgi:putative Holliday junction resolvase
VSRGQDLVLAIDFGLKRIGIATGNQVTQTATPIATLTGGTRPPWNDLDRLVEDWCPACIIVGIPSENDSNPLVQRIRGFVAAVADRYNLPVNTVDESHTSVEAAAQLRAGRSAGLHARRVTRGRIDRHAACLIAERWMRNHDGG